MESKTSVDSRRRSSLRNPVDMKKMMEYKPKSLHFDLDPIKESTENNDVSLKYKILIFYDLKLLIKN